MLPNSVIPLTGPDTPPQSVFLLHLTLLCLTAQLLAPDILAP